MDKKLELIRHLQEIKKRYSQGENILQYMNHSVSQDNKENVLNAIAVSYDLQAGAYTQFAENNPEYKKKQGEGLAKIIGQLGTFQSMVEAGVGEATTMAHVLRYLENVPDDIFGFDVSWSRIKFGCAYLERFPHKNASLFVGDFFHAPFLDNAIDIVYTSHSIEPNGGKEKEILRELYRIAKKYLVLCEPAFDLADQAAQQRMKAHGFACDIYPTAVELGYHILEHKLLDFSFNPLNPTGLTIIKKEFSDDLKPSSISYACPITKMPLEKLSGCYFSKESLLAYPIISDIPCLLPANAIVATHFSDFMGSKAKS